MDHSLSLKHFKRKFKNKPFCCFHICPGSSKNYSGKFWISNKKGFSNCSNEINNRHSLAFIPNGFDIISKLQNKHMGSFPIKLGNQPYTFDNFLKCLSAPNIWFAKYYLNSHHFAFIQNAFKTLPNFKTNCVVSFYFQ